MEHKPPASRSPVWARVACATAAAALCVAAGTSFSRADRDGPVASAAIASNAKKVSLSNVMPAGNEPAPALSPEALTLLRQVLLQGDHGRTPFMMVDKRNARLWVFDVRGFVTGSTPILLGAAIGDDSVPGIGDRPIELVKPEERTTPAGRFGLQPGRNHTGEDILWVDYDAAVSMHRVRATNPVERRLERLASPDVADNRISYGCINVPAAFYDGVVKPTFASLPRLKAAVYVLPEKRPAADVFAVAGRGSNVH